MKKRAATSHLRLIESGERGHSTAKKASIRRHEQLSFPYPETSTVFLVHLASIGKCEFEQILVAYMPRWIIDVRAVPRLDTIAASRLSAFTLFEKSKASYVDLFGRLGIKSYRVAESNPAFWSGAVAELLKNYDPKGPYLFLFDDEQLLRVAGDVLPEVIKSVVGRAARFALIQHSAGELTSSESEGDLAPLSYPALRLL
jgi:hypothetical protein